MAVGLLHAPPPGRVVVVVGTGSAGGVTVRLKVPCAPPYPSTTMKYVCPAVTVGVRREARDRPVELVHASSLHPTRSRTPRCAGRWIARLLHRRQAGHDAPVLLLRDGA